MSGSEIENAIARMKAHEKAFIRQLTREEQRFIIALFIHFPGCTIEEMVNGPPSPPMEQATLDL